MKRAKQETRLALRSKATTGSTATPLVSGRLLKDVKSYIEQARQRAAVSVNAELVALNWQIGKRIQEDILKAKRADYGRQIVSALGRQLTREFGPGFGEKNLRHMIRFVEAFPRPEIVSALRRQLSWSHFRELIYLEDPLRREFYAELCRVEGWSTRVLRRQMQSMLYERTALSKKPKQLIRQELTALRREDKLTPDLVFRDPYIFDLLGLKDVYNEKDLETAILRELENFILELGAGFAFVARQKRIKVDDQDYYLDLLFYHRGLRRLVAVELKLGKFRAADKGQMELYLRWLEKNEQAPGEDAPLGLILCAEKSAEHVQLLELEKSGIRVAQYLLELPPRKVLERKLHQALRAARKRLALKPSPATNKSN